MKKLLVLFTAFALVATASLAMAADWEFYGSSRVMTWYESGKAQGFLNSNYTVGNNAHPGEDGVPTGDLNFRDSELTWDMQGNARIGAKVKHGTVSGYFEYGTGVNVRKLYATWKPENASWELLVGQTYTPTTVFYSGQAYAADEGLLSTGVPYTGRQPMIQWSWEGLKLAFIRINGEGNFGIVYPGADGSFGEGNDLVGDVDVYLPRFEASYHYGADMWFADVAVGFQTYKVQDPLQRFDDNNINSGLVMVGGGLNLGPAYFKGQFYYGQNVGSYGLYGNDNTLWGKPIINPFGQAGGNPIFTNKASDAVLTLNLDANGNPSSYDTEDTNTYGLLAVAGFKLNDMVTFEGGAGYLRHNNDFFVDDAKVWAAYLQAPVTLAKGVFFVPEFGYYNVDSREDRVNVVDLPDGGQTFTSVDGENFWYIGAKWQINF